VRLLSAPLITTSVSSGVNAAQMRRLLRLGIILRWVAIGCAGLAGVLIAKPPQVLFYLMLVAMVYNLGLMMVLSRASEAALKRLALAATVIDQFFELGFIAIYGGSVPRADQVAPYMPGLIEAVAYFGAAGAALSVGIFFAFGAVANIVSWWVGSAPLSPTWLVEGTIIVALMAAILVSVNRILTAPADLAEAAPAVLLTRREQDVLRLVAEGYSNTMIATRLNLSDNTVKGYVESLLGRLNARNRAEAVAAASRLKLI
jgi:DNA-binding CsgD family transcriptional regulator